MERQRWTEMPLISGRSETHYVALVTKLLSSYCGAHLVESYCKKIKHFWYILAEISYYEISYYFRLDLDRVKYNYLCFGFFSEPTNPSHLKQAGLSYFFFDGDANDPNVQAAIKTKYVSFMTTSNIVPPILCPRFTAQCHEDYIEVYAGSSGITKCNKA